MGFYKFTDVSDIQMKYLPVDDFFRNHFSEDDIIEVSIPGDFKFWYLFKRKVGILPFIRNGRNIEITIKCEYFRTAIRSALFSLGIDVPKSILNKRIKTVLRQRSESLRNKKS